MSMKSSFIRNNFFFLSMLMCLSLLFGTIRCQNMDASKDTAKADITTVQKADDTEAATTTMETTAAPTTTLPAGTTAAPTPTIPAESAHTPVINTVVDDVVTEVKQVFWV